LPAWRARRFARATICLTRDAAAYADERVASFAHRVGPAVVDRLVEEAVVPVQSGGRGDPGSRGGRQIVLFVHLSEQAISFTGASMALARVDNTRSFVSAEQVATWCAAPEARITVRPVIDLRETTRGYAYEVPVRLADANGRARSGQPSQHRAQPALEPLLLALVGDEPGPARRREEPDHVHDVEVRLRHPSGALDVGGGEPVGR
jgi:hypothetical protein